MPKLRTETAMIRDYTRRSLYDFLVGYMSGRFKDDFNSLDAERRVDMAVRMLPYAFPKLQSTTLDVNTVDEGVKDKFLQVIEMSRKIEGK